MPTNPVLSNRALLLAKVETTYNVDVLPAPATDAFLVSATDVKINPNVLKREFYKPSLSPLGIAIGRKLASVTFTHEVKGSGLAASAPKLGTLMKGCGMAQTTIANTAADQIVNPVAAQSNTGPTITWTKVTPPTMGWGRYRIKIALGGASTVAKAIVFGCPSDITSGLTILPKDEFSATIMGPGATTTVAVNSTTDVLIPTYTVATPQIGDIVVVVVGGVRFKYTIASAVAATEATALAALIDPDSRMSAAAVGAVVSVTLTGGVTSTLTTAATNVDLGQSGAQVTLTWSGSLVMGDYYTVDVLQPGFHYTPVSTGFKSLTIYVYYDGTLHRMTGCIGNFTVTAAAGQYATMQFTFTGQYNNPDDQPLPSTSVFETTVPQQVELAQLMIGGAKLVCAQQVTLDMGIAVNPRECVSNADGYNGVSYTSREPKGGANPEMAYESEEPYWRNLAAATFLEFNVRVGTTQYNQMKVIAHSVQLSNNQYADRNNNRVYDLSYQFAADSFAGDDEIRFAFV